MRPLPDARLSCGSLNLEESGTYHAIHIPIRRPNQEIAFSAEVCSEEPGEVQDSGVVLPGRTVYVVRHTSLDVRSKLMTRQTGIWSARGQIHQHLAIVETLRSNEMYQRRSSKDGGAVD